MARQGNYVSVPGGNANWTKDLSSSLQGLSKSFFDQAENEERLALLEAERDYKRGRDAISDSRYDTEQGRIEKRLAEEQAMKDWVKNYSIDETTIRNNLARELGATDAELSGEYGDAFRKAVTPFREDITNRAGKDYLRQFGTPFDPNSIAPIVSNYPSLTSLQSREDELAKSQQDQYNKAADYDLRLAKVLADMGGSGSGSSKSGKSGSTRLNSVADIDSVSLANRFSKELMGPDLWRSSHALDAKNLIDEVKAGFIDENGNSPYKPQAVEAGIKRMLVALTEGNTLDSIDYDKDKALEIARQGAEDYRGRSGSITSAADLEQFLSGGRLRGIQPTNIREKARQDALARFAELRGQTAEPTTTTRPEAPAANTGISDLSNSILKRFGVNEVMETVAPPAQQPRQESSVALPRTEAGGNRREQLLGDIDAFREAQAGMEALINDPSTDPRTGFELRDQMLDMEAAIQEREQTLGNMDRYSQERELVRQAREVFGKDDIETDTFFVLPYNQQGKDKSWEEVVKDVNSRDSIKFTDKISKEEYEEAKGNPNKQRELLDTANSVIASDMLFRAASGDLLRKGSKVISEAASATGDLFTDLVTGFDPNDPDYAESLQEVQEKAAKEERVRNIIDGVERLSREQLGLPLEDQSDLGQLSTAFSQANNYSPVTNAITTGAALSVPLGKLGKAPSGVNRSIDSLLKRFAARRGARTAPKVASTARDSVLKSANDSVRASQRYARETLEKAVRQPQTAAAKAAEESARRSAERAAELVRKANAKPLDGMDLIDPRQFLRRPVRKDPLDGIELIDPRQFLRRPLK